MGRRWWQKEARAKAAEERLASKRAAELLNTASEAIKDGHISVGEIIAVAAAIEEVVEAVCDDLVSNKQDETPTMKPVEKISNAHSEPEKLIEEKIENVIEEVAPIAAAIVTKVVNNNQQHKNNNKNKYRR